MAPYSALAHIYDDVMAHVNYKRWAAYIHEIITRFRPHSHWIVDISCGTGTLCLLLARYGYNVTGMDRSPAMLKQAARKTLPQKNSYICADLRSLPFAAQPDVMVSLYDSMNYLMKAESWHKSLREIFLALKDNGLFIFDVSTIYNSRKDFARYIHSESFAGGSYHRRSTFDRKENIQTNYFEIKLSHQPGHLFCETHHQRIRHLEEIVALIDHSPFSLIAGYKEFSLEPYHENCERVHFVLKKNSSTC
ncbi:class I SAM-dependent methyltransferase [candidate division KSB1 bacterium]|nr:class I SAM-dependent methyltransferase [candidate division KSB1 bacterium]